MEQSAGREGTARCPFGFIVGSENTTNHHSC